MTGTPIKIWCFSIIFLLHMNNSYQENMESQQLVQKLGLILEARFEILDIRLNDLASMMRDTSPQEDPYHQLIGRFSSLLDAKNEIIERRLTEIEGKLAEVQNNQDSTNNVILQKIEHIDVKLSDHTFPEFRRSFNKIETTVGDVQLEMTSINMMSKQIELKLEALNETSALLHIDSQNALLEEMKTLYENSQDTSLKDMETSFN
ncbi:unnamed protein product, partial [Meganyctiphanes norvegica]